ncbi:hypothetical protein BDB00DRAFT_392550 [Zychaea mexicana]|uniref:uncharacterized protein n=1 Tax=Zychaea mexicana TaxID=64656 RepID=UPI0022FDE7B4|nr:uncharacterized protein BDB00DRAFT_392550 [Zychaea mexicana]KAI9498601.1 hypothetical protein BDB00DRAFT_392550 [Zychaea mexicana]
MTYHYKIGDRSADPMTAVLPYEIVLTVFSFLPTEQLVECLNVSSFWRYRLLRSPSLWRELELREADARCVKELYQVANMATSMTIYGDADLTAAFDLLIKARIATQVIVTSTFSMHTFMLTNS